MRFSSICSIEEDNYPNDVDWLIGIHSIAHVLIISLFYYIFNVKLIETFVVSFVVCDAAINELISEM